MKIQHNHFVDSISYLSMPLRKLPEASGPSARKSWFPHYYNAMANFDYVGPIPDIKYFGAEMGDGKRKDFLSWYGAER